jgi:hypothetical protein
MEQLICPVNCSNSLLTLHRQATVFVDCCNNHVECELPPRGFHFTPSMFGPSSTKSLIILFRYRVHSMRNPAPGSPISDESSPQAYR